MLQNVGTWPSSDLDRIESEYQRSMACIGDQCRDELEIQWFVAREKLRLAGDDVFRVEAILKDDVEESVDFIRRHIVQLTDDATFVVASDHPGMIAKLPLRIPQLMVLLLQLFTAGREEDLNNVLERAPLESVKNLAAEKLSVTNRMRGWLIGFPPQEIPMAFRERMTEPCLILEHV